MAALRTGWSMRCLTCLALNRLSFSRMIMPKLRSLLTALALLVGLAAAPAKAAGTLIAVLEA